MISQLSCILMQHKCDQILISKTIPFTLAQLQNSVNTALRTQKRSSNITQTSKEIIDVVFFADRLLDVWETLSSFSKYFLSNTLSQK